MSCDGSQINLATGQQHVTKEALFIADELLRLEDIEEDQTRWLEKNRRLVEIITDSHIRIGFATFTDAAEQLSTAKTIAPEWVKWRQVALESILNPSQVQPPNCPMHIMPLIPIVPSAESANVRALRKAYNDGTWLAEHCGYWTVVHHGTVEGRFKEHDAAMGCAIDKYGMLGHFMCPYIAPTYCHYKAQIYDQQPTFADEVRDL